MIKIDHSAAYLLKVCVDYTGLFQYCKTERFYCYFPIPFTVVGTNSTEFDTRYSHLSTMDEFYTRVLVYNTN